MQLPIFGGAYEGISKAANAQTCINLYFEPNQTQADEDMLVGTPGYTEFTSGVTVTTTNDTGLTIDADAGGAGIHQVTMTNHGFITGQLVDVSSALDSNLDANSTSITVVDVDNFTYDNGTSATDQADGVVGVNGDPLLGEVRAMYFSGGSTDILATSIAIVFCVIGNRLCYLLPNGNVVITDAARLTTTAGVVQIKPIGADITDGLLVVDGVAEALGNGTAKTIFYDSSASYATAFAESNTVAFLDGRLVRDDIDTRGRFVYSDIYDASVEDAFSFATAEGSFDDLWAIAADRRELWLFGEVTTEVWFNSGDANNPFQRFQNGFLQAGIAAPLTVARCDNTLFWLAQNDRGNLFVAKAGEGFQPQMVSPLSINHKLANYTTIFDAFAFSMMWEGHEWYVLTFPTEDVTWVYDAVARNWHQWRSGTSGRHIANCHAKVYRTVHDTRFGDYHLIGDSAQTGKIYKLVADADDDGAVIYRERTSANFKLEDDDIPFNRFQLEFEEGNATELLDTSLATNEAAGQTSIGVATTVGATVGDTLDIELDNGKRHLGKITSISAGTPGFLIIANHALPSPATLGNDAKVYESCDVTLEWSKDGGRTFGTAITRFMGTANTDYRAIWRKLGSGRNWVVRFKTSAAAAVRVLGAYAKRHGDSA